MKTKYLERYLLLLLAAGALMAPQTAQVNSYVNGQVLTADQLNAEFGNLYSTINGLDEANFLNTTSIAPAFLASTIAGDGLARNNTTGVLSVGVDDSTIEINTDVLRLKNLGVTSAKLANGSVTTAKLVTPLALAAGSAAAPSYSITGDTDTGLFSSADNTVSLAAGGTNFFDGNGTQLDINTSRLNTTGVFRTADGSVSAPSHSFTNETDTGEYLSGANALSIAAGGVETAVFEPTVITTRVGIATVNTSDGAIKWKVFTGSFSAIAPGSVVATITCPGTVIIGLNGMFQSGQGSNKWRPIGDRLDAEISWLESSTTDANIKIFNNFSTAATGDYKVVMYYQ